MKYIGEKSKKKVNLNLKFVLVHHHQQKQTDFNSLSLQIGAIKQMNQCTMALSIEIEDFQVLKSKCLVFAQF